MALLKYSLIRVAILVPLFVLFMFLNLGILFSAIAATLIAFCIAFLLFRNQRDAASTDIRNAISAEARQKRAEKRLKAAAEEDDFIEENPEIAINSDQKPRTKISTTE